MVQIGTKSLVANSWNKCTGVWQSDMMSQWAEQVVSLLCSAETWTLTPNLTKQLEALECGHVEGCWAFLGQQRWQMSGFWTGSVRRGRLWTWSEKRKLSFFGHLVRRENIHKRLQEGYIEGRRPRGRPRISRYDKIRVWTGTSFAEAECCIRQKSLESCYVCIILPYTGRKLMMIQCTTIQDGEVARGCATTLMRWQWQIYINILKFTHLQNYIHSDVHIQLAVIWATRFQINRWY